MGGGGRRRVSSNCERNRRSECCVYRLERQTQLAHRSHGKHKEHLVVLDVQRLQLHELVHAGIAAFTADT
jgi:hypothetical protein